MSMNCGMNAPKNTSTFGLASSTRNPCRKNPPRGGGGGASASDALDRRPDQLDAEPDQIGGAGKAHPVEPVAHGRHQRGQPDRDNADHDRKPRLDAGDIDQRRAGAVAQPVGDEQRDHRTRQQRQRDAGGDEGEIDLQGHGIFHWRHGRAKSAKRVFAVDVPAIHVLSGIDVEKKTWMPGTSPGMTTIFQRPSSAAVIHCVTSLLARKPSAAR